MINLKIMFYFVYASVFFIQGLLADTGFHDPNDPNLSSPIKKASESVYEIRTLFVNDLNNLSDLQAFHPSKKQSVLTAIDNLASDKRDKEIMKVFINTSCSTSVQECYLPTASNIASGFITGDGKTLWTNAHVLEHLILTKSVLGKKAINQIFKESGKAAIFIFNKKGEMVFNGLERSISFKVVPKPTNLAKAKGNFYAEDSDYIALDLGVKLGEPLKVSKTKVNPGDSLSIVGYPVCTGCDAPEGMDQDEFTDRYPFENAGDCEEKVTQGEALSLADWAEAALVNKHFMSIVGPSFIGNTADSQHGMSGGPILNNKGEVVGIHAGGKTVKEYGSFDRYSRGVAPHELFLEN